MQNCRVFYGFFKDDSFELPCHLSHFLVKNPLYLLDLRFNFSVGECEIDCLTDLLFEGMAFNIEAHFRISHIRIFLPAVKPSGLRTVRVVLVVGGKQFDVNLLLSYVISFSHS